MDVELTRAELVGHRASSSEGVWTLAALPACHNLHRGTLYHWSHELAKHTRLQIVLVSLAGLRGTTCSGWLPYVPLDIDRLNACAAEPNHRGTPLVRIADSIWDRIPHLDSTGCSETFTHFCTTADLMCERTRELRIAEFPKSQVTRSSVVLPGYDSSQ